MNTVEDTRLREIQLTGDIRAALAAHPRLSLLSYRVAVHAKAGGLDTVRVTLYTIEDEQGVEGAQ